MRHSLTAANLYTILYDYWENVSSVIKHVIEDLNCFTIICKQLNWDIILSSLLSHVCLYILLHIIYTVMVRCLSDSKMETKELSKQPRRFVKNGKLAYCTYVFKSEPWLNSRRPISYET